MFDVLPIYGQLQPGEQQLVAFHFYGHDYVSREVVAKCQVEEGPTYEIKLRGEASEVSYSLDSTIIDFGPQVFMYIFVWIYCIWGLEGLTLSLASLAVRSS